MPKPKLCMQHPQNHSRVVHHRIKLNPRLCLCYQIFGSYLFACYLHDCICVFCFYAAVCHLTLYAAALQIIDGEERRELAELELVAHGGECTPLAASADDDPAQPLLRDSIELLAAAAAAAVHGANGANGAHGPNRVASDTAPPASRAATAAVVAAGAGDAARRATGHV